MIIKVDIFETVELRAKSHRVSFAAGTGTMQETGSPKTTGRPHFSLQPAPSRPRPDPRAFPFLEPRAAPPERHTASRFLPCIKCLLKSHPTMQLSPPQTPPSPSVSLSQYYFPPYGTSNIPPVCLFTCWWSVSSYGNGTFCSIHNGPFRELSKYLNIVPLNEHRGKMERF